MFSNPAAQNEYQKNSENNGPSHIPDGIENQGLVVIQHRRIPAR
jgi:hypothetical protein